MEFDILYSERREDAFDAECVIAAVFFDEDELLSFGVKSDSLELDDAFYDYNQFEKAFELWSSPHLSIPCSTYKRKAWIRKTPS